jgi:hypothetical protein
MSAPGTTASQASPASLLARLRRGLLAVPRSLWVTALRDPVREGHLRLDALSRTERQLARAGLVLLLVLLGSMLFATTWRDGPLVPLSGSNSLRLVPVGAIGLTLLGLLLGWLLVVWGALDAAPSVRLLVALAFTATMSLLSDPQVTVGLDAAAMHHGPTVVRIGYLATAAGLVVSATLARWRRVEQVANVVLRGVLVVSLAMFFLGLLWMHAASGRAGLTSVMAFFIDESVDNLEAAAVPLMLVAAIVVVDLALDVSTGLMRPVGRLGARWVAVLLVLLIAVKLWFQVGTRLGVWRDLVAHQPLVVGRSALSVLLLVLLVALATRFPRSDTFTDAKEKVIYLGSLLMAAPFMLLAAGISTATAVQTQLDSRAALEVVDAIPFDEITRWEPLVVSLLVVGAGILLMRRSAGGYGDELGSAMVVIGGWNIPASVVSAFSVPIGLSFPTIDVLVTIGAFTVLVVAAVRRRRVPVATCVVLAAVVVFSWLVMSRADYVATLGGLLGLPVVVVVVFGVLYTLASDSAFAHESSRRLPADARPLLFVGYLLLSVVIIHWLEVTHVVSETLLPTAGFSRIAIPLAAWLVGRRLLRRDVQATAVAPPPSSGGPPAPLLGAP